MAALIVACMRACLLLLVSRAHIDLRRVASALCRPGR
ncbi:MULTISPECIES: putative leader peptide [unclassified Pseudofrankia]|nr:putative leader peptide [Pseudofrankia sp. BMG5.37]